MAPGYRRSSKNPQFNPVNNFYEKGLYKTENNFGTCSVHLLKPNAEALGYSQMSLRDQEHKAERR